MNDPYCPTLDEMNLTAEEQFIIESMYVITDDELLEMALEDFENVLLLIERKSRKRRMERMDPDTRKVFIERLHLRQQEKEEKRKNTNIEMENQIKEEQVRRQKRHLDEREKDAEKRAALAQENLQLKITLVKANHMIELYQECLEKITNDVAPRLDEKANQMSVMAEKMNQHVHFLEKEFQQLNEQVVVERVRYEELKKSSEERENALRRENAELRAQQEGKKYTEQAGCSLENKKPVQQEQQVTRSRNVLSRIFGCSITPERK